MSTKSVARPAAVSAFRRQLRVLEREMVSQLGTDTSCCGVTLAQCHTLLEISGSALSLTGLATALDLDTSTLSRTVDGLVRAGLVERTEDAADRRLLRLVLTPAGRDKVAFINETCNRYYAKLLATMNERDQRSVLRAVGLLAEGMRNLRGSSCSRTESDHG